MGAFLDECGEVGGSTVHGLFSPGENELPGGQTPGGVGILVQFVFMCFHLQVVDQGNSSQIII